MVPPASDHVAAHDRLSRGVARALRRRCGIGGGERLLVAVSGGADSVALLRTLAALAPRRRWGLSLCVGHVQHHLRDEAAEGDARFVETLAGQLGIGFERVDLEPPTEAGNIEAWARRQRYAALGRMARACGATHVATAHHADDQLETLLLRVIRGTGVRGLRGIAWRRRLNGTVTLIRPMLAATRAEVIAFLRAIDQAWCEDHTNADVTRDRARLRHEVLPVLHELREDAAAKAVRLSEHARDVHRLVQSEISRQRERIVRMADGEWSLSRDEARRLPRVVLTGLFGALLREAGVPADRLKRATLGPIVRAVRDREGGERRFELAGGMRVVVRRESVAVERDGPAAV